MTENLWGDIPEAEAIRTPHGVLREQGAKLRELTQGLLVGRVSRQTLAMGGAGRTPVFVSTLRIIAPALDNYTYEVATIEYSIGMYPLTIMEPSGNKSKECVNEAALVTELHAILSSEKMKKLVRGLLAQIRSDT